MASGGEREKPCVISNGWNGMVDPTMRTGVRVIW